jgi:hypothetical protein
VRSRKALAANDAGDVLCDHHVHLALFRSTFAATDYVDTWHNGGRQSAGLRSESGGCGHIYLLKHTPWAGVPALTGRLSSRAGDYAHSGAMLLELSEQSVQQISLEDKNLGPPCKNGQLRGDAVLCAGGKPKTPLCTKGSPAQRHTTKWKWWTVGLSNHTMRASRLPCPVLLVALTVGVEHTLDRLWKREST